MVVRSGALVAETDGAPLPPCRANGDGRHADEEEGACRVLPVPEELRAGRVDVVAAEELTAASFARDYIVPNRPAVVKGSMDTWASGELWTDEYLAEAAGHLTVNVEHTEATKEFGDLSGDWRFDEMTLERFLRVYRYNDEPGVGHFYLDTHLPRDLGRDIAMPAYVPCLRMRDAPYERLTNLWMGSGGETSLLHNDLQDNLVHVVAGFKVFTLFPPNTTGLAERLDVERTETRLSPVNPDRPDYERFPEYRDARGFRVVLGPGDALFVPALWWHQVTSIERSVMVNIWFDFKDYARDGLDHVYATPTREYAAEMATHAPLCDF